MASYNGRTTRVGKTDLGTAKRNKEKKEYQEMMQAQIEAEYQSQIAKQDKRGALDRVFDVLSTPGYMVNGALQDGWKGIGEGFKAGIDGFAFNNKEYGKEYSAEDSIDMLSQGKWSEWKPDSIGGKVGKGAVNLIGEIVTDPLTYLGGAGIAKSIGKGSGKRLGKETVEEITEKMIKTSAKEKAIDLAPSQIKRYTEKANKLAGNAVTKGDVTFAGMPLKGSGDALRTLGDKTIAPIFNTAGDAIRGSNKLFDSNNALKKALKEGRLDEFVGTMNLKDKITTDKLSRFGYIGEKAREASGVFGEAKDNNPLMREVSAMLENPDNYENYKTLIDVEDGDKLLTQFVEEMTGKPYSKLLDSPTASKAWEEVVTSENPFERLAQPKDKFERWIFKKQIDPDNKFATYSEAYDDFVTKSTSVEGAMPTVNMKDSYDMELEMPKQQVHDDSIFSTIAVPGKELEIDMPTGNFDNALTNQKREIMRSEFEEMVSKSAPETAEMAVNPRTREYLINNFRPNGKTDYDKLARAVNDGMFPDMKTARKTIDDLVALDDIANGRITTPQVKNKFMELDASLPPEFQTKDLYTETILNPQTGEIIEEMFNPYTGETTKNVAQQTMLQQLPKPAEMTKMDWLMNYAYTDTQLNNMLNDFMQSQAKSGKYVLDKGKIYAERMGRRLKDDMVSAQPELREMTQFLYKEFQNMGASEEAIKKLNNTIEAYMPHMINREMFKNPNIMKKLQKQDPELFRTVFASAGEKWNPHGTERSAVLEQKVKEILTNKRKSMNQDYSDVTGKTIAQVNEALQPILKEAGFDGNFFLDNAYDIYMQRMITHGEVLYSDRTINQTLENFGKYVPRGEILPKKKYVLNQQEMREVFKGMDETQQFKLLQEMGIDVDKVYNKMLIQLDGERLEKIYRAVEKYGNPENKPLQPYELPDNIFNMANNKGYVQQMDDMNAFLKVYDKVSNLWKQTATVLNPGFHMRNKFSNTFQNYLAVGGEVFNPQTRDIAKQVLHNQDGMLVTKSGNKIPFKEIRDQLASRDIVNMASFNPVEGFAEGATNVFEQELQGSGGLLEAIGRATGRENPGALNKLDPTDTANFVPFVVGRKFGGKVEDYDRTLNFIANIKNDLDFDTAQEMVDKFLFDYSDLTSFETNVMKRIVPFYTWLRKNAPLQMEMLLEKPGVYAGIADFTRMNDEGKSEHLPDYMKEYVRLPVEWDDKELYVNINMPYQDLGKDLSDPAEVVGMLNPMIKAGVELGNNKNYFFDSQIWDDDDTFEQAKDKIGKYLKQSAMGSYNTWEKVLGGDVEKAVGMATGFTPRVFDKKKAEQDAIYRAIRNVEQEVEKQKASGKSRFNQPFEEYKKTKLEKYGY